MARAKLNPLSASISGKIGEIVVAERPGKFFVRKLRTRTTPPGPKELERRKVFRQADRRERFPVPARDSQQRTYGCLSGSSGRENSA